MPDDGAIVRPASTPSEVDAFFRLATRTFAPEAPLESAAGDWRDYLLSSPDFHPAQLRGAFRGDEYLGGCIVHERTLRLGPARIWTACVGAVAVHPDRRRCGVASTLLSDAAAFARERGHGLLLLDGIPDFYHRFGYADVLDVARHAVDRRTVLELPASPCRVRSATVDDAPALLALYERHCGHYPGSFERNLTAQAHQIQGELPGNPPFLALSSDGEVRGYLIFGPGPRRARAKEIAAEDWPAALALLQHHARLLDDLPEPPAELIWPLPEDSPTFYALTDHVTVRTESKRVWRGGWMARPADLSALLEALLPLWRERWTRRRLRWDGALELTIVADGTDDPGAVFGIELERDGARLSDRPGSAALSVRLSAQALAQLVFSYRPIRWIAAQPGQSVPDAALPALEALFPLVRTWIPGSDAF